MNGENGLLVYLFDQRTDSTVDQPAKKSLFAGYPKLAVEVHRGRQILDTDVYIYLSDESKPTKPRAYIYIYYIILYYIYYIILYYIIYIYIYWEEISPLPLSAIFILTSGFLTGLCFVQRGLVLDSYDT
jgi:hypothetical protein